MFYVIFCTFFFFFPFVTKKTEKLVLVSKNDFNQRLACGAPVCWSKYTTVSDANKKYKAGNPFKSASISCHYCYIALFTHTAKVTHTHTQLRIKPIFFVLETDRFNIIF